MCLRLCLFVTWCVCCYCTIRYGMKVISKGRGLYEDVSLFFVLCSGWTTGCAVSGLSCLPSTVSLSVCFVRNYSNRVRGRKQRNLSYVLYGTCVLVSIVHFNAPTTKPYIIPHHHHHHHLGCQQFKVMKLYPVVIASVLLVVLDMQSTLASRLMVGLRRLS